MKRVATRNLPVNSYISSPVFLDEKYILLSPDVPINEQLISRLLNWEFHDVHTEGMPSENPAEKIGITVEEDEASAGSSVLDTDIKERNAEKVVREFFSTTVEFMEDYFKRFLEKDELNINTISEKVKEIITQVKQNRRFILSLADEKFPESSYLVINSVKTTIVTIAIVDFLKLPPHKQIEVGISALLHQIGMLRIPSEIYMNDHLLSEREKQIIITYPVISFKILKEAGFPPPVYLAVLEHHEYMDGTGYPRKLTGDKISLYGKLVGVASAYCAATSKRPFREGRDGHSGIMDLLKEMGKRYDDKILRALVFTLSIYPIGTYVQLSNGARAIVVKTDQENPKLPTLRLLINENNLPYADQPILQTRAEDSVKIQKPLTKTEITEIKERLHL